MTKKFTKGIAKVMSVLVCLTVLLSACFALASCGDTIELDVTEKTIYVSDTFRLTATTSNEEALIEWASSDSKVASVRRGVVTGVGKGTATITATTDSGATATCEVTVLERTLTISQTEATIDLAESNTLKLTATSSVEGDKFTWSSNDPAVATVDGGLVTAVDIGTTIITASVGNSSVYCMLTVTDSDLPADYRTLESGQMSTVVGDPGEWYYFADGRQGSNYEFSSDVPSYEAKPSYQNGGVQVRLSELNNKDDGSTVRFLFRYQPGGADGTGLEVGDEYKITFTVETNASGNVGCTGGSIDVEANEPQTVTRQATVSASEPLYISVSSANFGGDKIPADGLFFRISNISIEKYTYEGVGELTVGQNAVVRDNPGVWYYHDSHGVYSAKPSYDAEANTLSVTATSWGNDAFYFRYQPSEEKDGLLVGDWFTASFTVATDFDAYIRYGFENAANSKIVAVTANTPVELTMDATEFAEGSGPFFISIGTQKNGETHKLYPSETPGTFKVSEIVLEKTDAPQPAANPVVSATVQTQPTKTDYVAGDTFDPTGMVLGVTYEDQTTGTITVEDPADVSFSAEPLTEGQTSVEVIIGEATVTVTITVAAAPVAA